PTRANGGVGERHNREPGAAVVAIDGERVGEMCRDDVGIHGPVGEQELPPLHRERDDHTRSRAASGLALSAGADERSCCGPIYTPWVGSGDGPKTAAGKTSARWDESAYLAT